MIEQWEMASCPWERQDTIDRLLSEGWEPFAIGGMNIWFRRKKQ